MVLMRDMMISQSTMILTFGLWPRHLYRLWSLGHVMPDSHIYYIASVCSVDRHTHPFIHTCHTFHVTDYMLAYLYTSLLELSCIFRIIFSILVIALEYRTVG